MMRASRIEELMSAMKSFGNEKYEKSELLTEMLTLQREIVELTFNDEHAYTADLKIWDVERHLEQMNQDCGNVADEELEKFKNGSKTLCNLIKAEISGAKGEAKAFRTLQNIRSKNIVLKNVELNDGNERTELDAIVITRGAITIIEVKNTAKDIFIDENGNYFRTGEFLRWDCNIAEKMLLKENLLRKALENSGVQNVQIRNIVAFTDTRIEVQNRYPYIRTCFVSQLPYIIGGFKGDHQMTDEEMEAAEAAIRNAENKEAYPFEFDVPQYKRDFATLMVILEEATTQKEAATQDEDAVDVSPVSTWFLLRSLLKPKFTSNAVAAATVTIVSTVAMNVIRKGGMFR